MLSTLRIAHETSQTKKAHKRLINLQNGLTSPPVSTQLQHRSTYHRPGIYSARDQLVMVELTASIMIMHCIVVNLQISRPDYQYELLNYHYTRTYEYIRTYYTQNLVL